MILSTTGRLAERRLSGLRYEEQTFENSRKFKDVAVPSSRWKPRILHRRLSSTPRFALGLPLLAWSPYGKHRAENLGMMPGADVPAAGFPGTVSGRDTGSEYWSPSGLFDHLRRPRGAWSSEEPDFWSTSEADDGQTSSSGWPDSLGGSGKVGKLGCRTWRSPSG